MYLHQNIMFTFFLETSPIRYHGICINNRDLVCFHDLSYLCICDSNHTRVECFPFDQTLDQCSYCLAGGRCLKGNPTRSNTFHCICPPCHSGRRCQFNSKSFTYTLDQLLYTDLISIHRQTIIYLIIIVTSFGFLLAIPSNLFLFVTLRRRKCRQNVIGQYLICMSVINQINLALFMARLVHIIVTITGVRSSSIWHNILCKLLNYLLSSSSRFVYWLSSLIAIERVCMTLIMRANRLRKAYVTRRLIASIMTIILLTAAYEILFYKFLFDINEGHESMCVFEFPDVNRSVWMFAHLLVSIVNSLLPLLINLCSTIVISMIVIRKKMKTVANDTRKSTMRLASEYTYIYVYIYIRQ
jgi:hypothetical protein